MKYAILTNDQITAHGDSHALWPNTSFSGGVPDFEFLTDKNAVSICSDIPYDAATQKLNQVEPYLLAGTVYDVQAVDSTPAELAAALAAKRAAMSCTMRQARLALLQVGKLDEVDSAIAAMSEPEKSTTRINWEYAASVDRVSPFVESLGGALGMTESDLDALFALAATL